MERNLCVVYPGSSEKSLGAYRDAAYDDYAVKINNAIRTPFKVNDKDLAMLGRYFDRDIVRGSAKNLIDSPHPVFASLNHFAYQDVQKAFRDTNTNIIEIGSAFREKSVASHHCILLNCSRDAARYMYTGTNQSFKKATSMLGNQLQQSVCRTSTTICSSGTENCTYQAQYAFSVNAHYDIPFELNAKIMNNHGINIMYVYMFLLPEQINEHFSQITSEVYGVNYIEKKGIAQFSMNDYAFVYQHNAKNWRKYLTHTRIESQNFIITIEIDRSWGVFHRLRFVRTPYYAGINIRQLPFKSIMSKFVIIPNLYIWINCDAESKLGDDTLIIPAEFYHKCLGYISRQADDAFSFNHFYAFANSLSVQVKFDGRVIWEGWCGSNPTLWTHSIISMFCMGALTRHDRTQTISKFFNEVKLQDTQWLYKFKKWFSKLGDTLDPLHWFTGNKYNRYQKYFKTTYEQRFKNNTLKFLHAMTFDDVYTAGVSKVRQEYRHTIDQIIRYNLPVTNPQHISHSNDDIRPIANHALVFDPPSDGYCGLHALGYINGMHTDINCKCMDLLDKLDIDNAQHAQIIERDGWYAYDELAIIAEVNGIGVVLHEYQMNQLIKTRVGVKKHKLGITRNGPHYQVNACNCVSNTCLDLSYDKLPLSVDYLYVNCADRIRNDGSGQAKAFRNLFPDYPRHETDQPIEFIKHKNYHLAICNTTDNLSEGAIRVKAIISAIKQYSIDNCLRVYMPFIGTGVFNLPYHWISENINNDPLFIYVSPKQTDFDAIDDDIRAGGFSYTSTLPPNTHTVKADPELWKNIEQLPSVPGRVNSKISILLPNTKHVTEISYAPGNYAEYCESNGIEFVGYHYTGPNALPLKYKCKNHHNFESIDVIKDSFVDVLIDIGPEEVSKTLVQTYIKFINRNNFSRIAIKLYAFQNNPTNEIVNATKHKIMHWTIIKPQSSALKSSEFYLVMNQLTGTRSSPPKTLDVTDIFEKIVNPRFTAEEHAKTNADLYAINYNGEHIMRYQRSINSAKLPIHTRIIEYISQKDYSKTTGVLNVEIRTGCSGAGKTADLVINADDIYVAPLSRLMSNASIKTRPHCTHEVFINRLIDGDRYNTVYIDEYCLLPKGYYALLNDFDSIRKIVLLGDPRQISLVDFESVYTDNDNMKHIKKTWDVNRTKRYGKKTCKLIKELLGYEIISEKEDFVQTIVKPINKHTIKEYRDAQWITFSQENKTMLIGNDAKCCTIHESMGSTYPNVVLYVNGKDLMNGFIHNAEYTYVGMTRHLNTLTVIADYEDGVAIKYLNTLDTMIDVNLARNNAAPFTDVHLTKDEKVYDNAVHFVRDDVFFDVKTSIQGVEQIFNDLNLSNRNIEILEQYDAVLPDVPRWSFSGDKCTAKIKITNFRMHPKRVQIIGQRLAQQGYSKYYAITDSFKTTQTFIARYMQTAQRRPKLFKSIISAVKVLRDGFIKMTKFKTAEEYYQFCTPTPEDICRHATAYVVSLREKGINDRMMADIDRQLTELKVEIDFFMKNQPKHVTNMSKYTQFKAGQGVSSWPKCMNLLFCAYTRHLNDLLPDCMSDGTTKKFISQFACNKSDAELSKQITLFANEIADGTLKPMGTDFTEHDTSHSMLVKFWECMDFIGCGFPPSLVQDYFDIYANWTQTNIAKEGKVTVYNHWIQHSGSSNTLHGNTKLTIGANGACFEFKRLRYIGFKGDDTESLSAGYKFTKFSKVAGSKLTSESQTLLKDLFGFKLKIDDNPVGEFICNFVHPGGFFPDILRRTARMISKIHADETTWNQARINMNECMEVINSPVAYNTGIMYAARYYNHIGINITPDQIDYLCHFAANVKYADFIYPKQEYIIDVFSSQ